MKEASQPSPLSASTVSVVEEQVRLSTQVEQVGAVRVRIEADDVHRPVSLQQITHAFETVRVPRGITVPQARDPWTEGDVLVVPVYEEVEVVERRLVLREEIRLVPVRQHETRQLEVPLRRERAVVERQQPDGSWHRVAGSDAAGTSSAPTAASHGSSDPIDGPAGAVSTT